MKTLTPDIIRKTALEILSKHPEGIRQAELFRKTEFQLSYDYIVRDHAIRNALWNLANIYPEHVVKKKISARNVVLYPRKEEHMTFGIKESTDNQFFIEKEALFDDKKMLLSALSYKVIEIYTHIEMSDIDKIILDIQQRHHKELTIAEAEILIILKQLLRQFKDIRSRLAHIYELLD